MDNEDKPMTDKRSWIEFSKSGLLWWINRILHTFGWAIAVEMDELGNVTEAYPCRVKYRGFDVGVEQEGFSRVSKYIAKEGAELVKETELDIPSPR